MLVLSPEDSPVHIDHPQVTCRSAGKAGWKGEHVVWRQVEHWKIIAEFPQRFLLLNDADSVCLSPGLPAHLYGSPDTFWSTEIPGVYAGLNYLPPYFLTQETLDKLIAATTRKPTKRAAKGASGSTGGRVVDAINWGQFEAPDSLYVATTTHVRIPHQTHRPSAYPPGWANQRLLQRVLLDGVSMVHGMKSPNELKSLRYAYEVWSGQTRPDTIRETIR